MKELTKYHLNAPLLTCSYINPITQETDYYYPDITITAEGILDIPAIWSHIQPQSQDDYTLTLLMQKIITYLEQQDYTQYTVEGIAHTHYGDITYSYTRHYSDGISK